MKKKDLQEQLEEMQKSGQLKNAILVDSDARSGRLISLAVKTEFGTLRNITSYFTYSEMACFLCGYAFAKEEN